MLAENHFLSCVSIEVDLGLVRVVELVLVAVRGIKLDLISV